MSKILDTIGGILNKGADYAIARQNAIEAARLPAAAMTPNEQLVQQGTPPATVKNDSLAPTGNGSPSFWAMYGKQVGIGVAVALGVAGLIAVGRKAFK